MGRIYNDLEQYEQALDYHRKKAVHLGYDDLMFLLEDESLESIREEIEFQRLVRGLKMRLDREK